LPNRILPVDPVVDESARETPCALGPAANADVATGATGMRKGFDGLFGPVQDELALHEANQSLPRHH
jgi:hypothetical protein